MHRVQPTTQKGYLLVAHTAFPSTKGTKDRGWSKLRTAFFEFLSYRAITIMQLNL